MHVGNDTLTRMRKRVAAILFMLSCAASAQEITGTIVGKISDPSGAPIPEVAITVKNTDLNAVIRKAVTNGDGYYTAPFLPIGKYSVTAENKGFKKATQKDIQLNINDTLTINLKLEVGDVMQEVTVDALAARVELQSATAQTLISGDQVRELSLNNRNYEQLVTLMPGVSSLADDQIFVGVSNFNSGQSNTVRFSINGGRTSSNNWTVDGADNVDRGANLTLLTYPSVDAIAEFRVLRGQYSAEYGRSANAHVNVVTKSGGTDFHGSAYEFFRNDQLGANTFANTLSGIPRPPLRYNDFGYTLGGPVYIPGKYNKDRNKTFFFWSQEFRRIITYGAVQAVVPTAAEKQGHFAVPVCVQASGSTCTQTATDITNINPVAAAYIKDIFSKIPDGNSSHSINTSLRNIFNSRQELAKVDHIFSSKLAVSFRFINDTIPTEEPRGLFTGAALPGVSTTTTNSPGKSYVARVTGTLTPTIINEAGFAYSFGAVLSTPIGLNTAANSPDIKAVLPFAVTLGRVPTLGFGGTISTLTGFGPYNDYNRNYNWFDNITKITGKHTIKAGFSFNHYQKTENDAGNNVGTFNFATTPRPTGGTTTTQAWANFLLGNVGSFTQLSRDLTPDIRVNQLEMYVQDEYRIKSNLTLSLGLRYSIFRQPTDANNSLNNFDPTKYDPSKAPQVSLATGLIIAGTGDPLNGIIVNNSNSPYGSKVTNESNTDFAPRFGFSWDPFKTGKTAVRGGYGYAYDFPQVGIYETTVTANPPSVSNINIPNTRFENPGAGTPSISANPVTLVTVPQPWKTPYVQQWSFDIQREVSRGFLLDVGYFGAKGTHLIGKVDINQVAPGAGVAAGILDSNTPFTSATSPRLNALRPYRGYGPINAIESWFNSTYNALQASLTKRFGAGAFLGISYTWSKALTDNGSDTANAPQNTYNRDAEYGPAPFDRTQVLTANWSYKLPFFKDRGGILENTLGGWQVSGIATFNSGLPLTVTSTSRGFDPAGLGIIGTSATSPREDLICDPNKNAPHTIAQWFNTACFIDVPNGQVRPGNAGRGIVRGPGYQRWDMSAFKNFQIGERVRLQFRGEMFNIFNHVNYSGVSVSFGSSVFGTVTSFRDPRIVQLGLKLIL